MSRPRVLTSLAAAAATVALALGVPSAGAEPSRTDLTFPEFGNPPAAGVVERHLVLRPVHIQRLAHGELRTELGEGITHIGGPVREVLLTKRTFRGRTTGAVFSTIPASGGKTPAKQGDVVQSGCSKIDIPGDLFAYGCYERKLAQAFKGGEYLVEGGQVSGSSRFYSMVEVGNTLEHNWVDRYAYVYSWSPDADQRDLNACRTTTWSLALHGVGWSRSAAQCPTNYRIRLQADNGGAKFGNSWFGKVRPGNTRSATAIDSYRWQVPVAHRGAFRYVVAIDTDPGSRQTCSGTCTRR